MNPLNFFRQNIFLKILSLFFAIILWFFVVLEDKVEQDIEVFISYQNPPQGLVVVNSLPEKVKVKVVGPRSILRNLTRKNIVLRIDLDGLERGRHLIVLHPKDIPIPAGLEIIAIHPEKIEVVLERKVSHLVPVEPLLEGSPPPGWKLVQVTVVPSRVRVQGPESLVYKLHRLRTKPIDLSNLTGDVCRTVELEVPYMITVHPSRLVKVKLSIREKIVEWEVKDLSVVPVGDIKPQSLEPNKVSVVLRGPERLLGPLSGLKIRAVVDVSHLPPGRHLVPVQLEVPAGVKILKLEPKKIAVVIPK